MLDTPLPVPVVELLFIERKDGCCSAWFRIRGCAMVILRAFVCVGPAAALKGSAGSCTRMFAAVMLVVGDADPFLPSAAPGAPEDAFLAEPGLLAITRTTFFGSKYWVPAALAASDETPNADSCSVLLGGAGTFFIPISSSRRRSEKLFCDVDGGDGSEMCRGGCNRNGSAASCELDEEWMTTICRSDSGVAASSTGVMGGPISSSSVFIRIMDAAIESPEAASSTAVS